MASSLPAGLSARRLGGAAAGPPDRAVPAALRPLVRAYLLGYASSVGPRLLTALLTFVSARHRLRAGRPLADARAASAASLRRAVLRILRAGLDWRRFPAFCAALVGGSTLLEDPLRRLLARCAPGLAPATRTRLARFLAAFAAAAGALRLLQADRPSSLVTRRTVQAVALGKTASGAVALEATTTTTTTTPSPPLLAGRTLDLTLFAVTRAVDVLVGAWWARRKTRRVAAGAWTRPEALVARLADPAIFAASSALVMWAWFYEPARLPHAYNKWITSAAAVDARLVDALRLCRAGTLQYGRDTGPDARLLETMCRDYGWPAAWGNPAVTVPFPCTMVHMDAGPSCEVHALVRWARSWRWSMATYLPLSLLLLLRRPGCCRTPAAVLRALLSALRAAARSSAFLASFVTLFFYGVCLARTRLGPRLLGASLATRQAVDAGLCTAAGCALCGWSILLERPARRTDMGLFVAPRALATLLPRRYPRHLQWRETLVFAASTAVVFATVQENPRRVRGVMGSLLQTVFAP